MQFFLPAREKNVFFCISLSRKLHFLANQLIFLPFPCIVRNGKAVVYLNKIRQYWQPHLTRPLIYMAFTRFVCALAAALLGDFFLSASFQRDLRQSAFLLFAALFFLLAWIAYLRLDGIRLPKWMMLRLNIRKKPARMYGDIIDYVDEHPPVTFEELEDEEKDLCILGADAFCCVAFLLAALIV